MDQFKNNKPTYEELVEQNNYLRGQMTYFKILYENEVAQNEYLQNEMEEATKYINKLLGNTAILLNLVLKDN
jgi:trehalose-6-phosphate synthase